MAVLAKEEFEAGTIGAAVQESEVIFVNVDNTGITYVTGLDGTAKACNVAPATTGACRDSGFIALNKLVVRFIFKFSSLPIADTVIAHLCQGDPNAGGLRVAHLYLTTAGKLVVKNVFTTVGTSVMTFSTGTEYAVEWMFDGATNKQTLRMFTNVSTTANAAETIGPVDATAASTIDWIQIGKMTNTTWTGGLTFDRYKRANDWVSSSAVTTDQWNLEWAGTAGNDISVPVGWVKEGSNTNSPKYASGGPNIDQSYLNYLGQNVGNRNLVSPQLPSGLATYERFYMTMNGKPDAPEQNETIWAAGSLAGVILFRLVAASGVNNTYNLELWADNDWNPTAPDPGVGQPPLPLPLGTIENLNIDTFHRIEIDINGTSGPAVCTVKVWEGARRNEPASPDQQISGSCVGTSLLRYRRYGQMLHSTVDPTVSHKGVGFDGIRVAQNGTAIGPLVDTDQFNPPLNQDWQFYEWNGSDLVPLSLAGASTGGSTLEEVQFTDQVTPPTGDKLFTGDPGLGSKLYVGSDAYASSDRYNLISDLMNFKYRLLSSGSGHPASDRCAPGFYRGFYSSPRPDLGWGSHTNTSWSITRKVAANCAISSWSFDTGGGATENVTTQMRQDSADEVATWYNGNSDFWLTNTLAPMLKEAYNRYGHLTVFDLGNEADRGDAQTQGLNPLWIHRMRRAVRYIHFFLINQCDVPEEAFMVSMVNCVQATAYDTSTGTKRDSKAINTTDLSWPGGTSARGDAMYYYVADWKETKTTTGGYWTDAFDPNPADFIQPGELDEWSYGRGPTHRAWAMNTYERDYEYANIETLAEFRGKVLSVAGGYPRAGNWFKFNKALYGTATPVLDVPSANRNGLPVFIGEMGHGIWVPLPSSTNDPIPSDTADAYEIWAKDLTEVCNVAGYAKWRYVQAAYDTNTDTQVDTFTHHYKVGSGAGAGTHIYDTTNTNTKAEASVFGGAHVADPPPWPNGTPRPPNVSINSGAKRDYRGFGDVPT